jgi:hypothetical protein
MATIELSADKVDEFLRSLNGGFFTIRFIKRTTGEERVMNATKNLTKHLKGGEAKYNAKEKGLLIVTDTKAQAIRSIPTDAVLDIKANGNIYIITKAGA